MASLVYLTSLSIIVCGNLAQSAEFNPAETFKHLLSNPPIIREMVYLDKSPRLARQAASPESGGADSTDSTRYFLVWQPNAISFHSVPKVSITNNRPYYDEFFLGWEEDFYFLNGRQFAFRYKRPPGDLKPGAFPAAYHAALIKLHAACEPLNLGINHLNPGSVVWHGDNFYALGSADQKPIFISGRISSLSNTIPTEMQVQYSNDMGVANYRIAYEYNPYRPPYYPTRISTYFQHKRTETRYREYQIVSVQSTNVALTRAAFDPSSYRESLGIPLRILTNNSVYSQLPSGELIESPGAAPKLHLTGSDYYLNRYYYLAAIIIAASFLHFAVKRSYKLEHKP